MTDEWKDNISLLVSEWRRILRLYNWDIVVVFSETSHPEGKPVGVEVTYTPNQYSAVLTVYPALYAVRDNKAEVRHAVIHNLVHCWTVRLQYYLDDLYAAGAISRMMYNFANESMQREIELVTDEVARVISDLQEESEEKDSE